jgi:hypothetical protein
MTESERGSGFVGSMGAGVEKRPRMFWRDIENDAIGSLENNKSAVPVPYIKHYAIN